MAILDEFGYGICIGGHMNRIALLVLATVLCGFSFVRKDNVSQFVDEYFTSKGKAQLHDECRDPVGDCMDVTCRLLGQYGCDDKAEVEEVLLWCRGNFDGDCIQTACRYLGQNGCDDRGEVQEIARACVGNFSGECVDVVCKRLGQYGCDDRQEILNVIKKCAGF